MAITKIYPASRLKGKVVVPGDKSITHRALLLGALAEGYSEILKPLVSEDTLSTWSCLEKMGVILTPTPQGVQIKGCGKSGLKQPSQDLNCGNSGTTIRLLMGILAGHKINVRMIGDSSLCSRPMKRIADPLQQMGAQIALTDGNRAPLNIRGIQPLCPIHYHLDIASAQLKSALLFAGLFADGTTSLFGKIDSRDHTERLLPHFGISLFRSEDLLTIQGRQKIQSNSLTVPGDLSSAAFWIAAATLIPGTSIELENISLNPTRMGLFNILKRMGARIEKEETISSPEPMGNLRIFSASLQATKISPSEIPSLIDELPLLAILAIFAEGVTEIRGAEELRHKETDRIHAIAHNLNAMGIKIEVFQDGFSIRGPQIPQGAKIRSFGDHRIAMAFSIAGLKSLDTTWIEGSECVRISYPSFYKTLFELTR